jgi:hypothetical protein
MAVIARFDVRNMTDDKYAEVVRRLDAAGAGTPRGRIYHICYGRPDSLQFIDVYDSAQSMESFGRTLGPILQELGIEARPEVEEVFSAVSG